MKKALNLLKEEFFCFSQMKLGLSPYQKLRDGGGEA